MSSLVGPDIHIGLVDVVTTGPTNDLSSCRFALLSRAPSAARSRSRRKTSSSTFLAFT